MILFPAIDIKNGKVVRLSQGKFHEVTIYSNDPVATAKNWQSLGARWLHVIDLDGAQTGEMKNISIIHEIAKAVTIPIQVGGGIRSEEQITKLLSSNINRIILGTRVIEDKVFCKKILNHWQNRIIVSIDASRGIVAQKGWSSLSTLKATDFAKELESFGLTTLIYTDIARDGTLKGPNIPAISEILSAVKIPVIASGGVSSLEDLKQLKKLEPKGLAGAIVGKAIYESHIDIQQANQLCLQSE